MVDVDLSLSCGPLHRLEVVPEATCEAIEQSVTTGEHDVREELALHIFITAHDALVQLLMEAFHVTLTAKCGLEQHLRASETLVADQNLAPIRHFVVHLAGVRLSRLFKAALEVSHDVRHGLFDVLNGVRLALVIEGDATLFEDLAHVVCEVTSAQRDLDRSVRDGVTFKDRHNVRDRFTGVNDHTCSPATCKKRKHCLQVKEQVGHIERLEHDLSHALTISLRVQRCFSQHDWVLLGRNSQLAEESMVPHFLEIIPINDLA